MTKIYCVVFTTYEDDYNLRDDGVYPEFPEMFSKQNYLYRYVNKEICDRTLQHIYDYDCDIKEDHAQYFDENKKLTRILER